MHTRLTIFCYILTGCILFCASAAAQKRNNVWVFGNHSGIDFNTSPPSAIDSTPIEGKRPPFYTSSICDKDGVLLFYTDGITVWDGTDKIVKRARRWPWYGNVMPLICPASNNDSMFYLFGISDKELANDLLYVQVKVPTSTGRPELLVPPGNPPSHGTSLLSGASLLIAGTAHCNEKDNWVVAHSSDRLNAYLVTESGVSATPVVSSIPANIAPSGMLEGGNSNMKFSANGEKLVLPLTAENKIALFDFDKAAGRFSNGIKISLPAANILEDAELSPDGTKLYVGAYKLEYLDVDVTVELHYIYQYDLEAGSVAQIEQSKFHMIEFPDRAACSPKSCIYINRTLQLGPDGRIYVSMRETAVKLDLTASVITDPNKKGVDALYRRNLLNIKRKYIFINYNYIRSGSFSLKENGILVQKKTCSDQPVSFALLFNHLDSVRWDFGDPQSGALNTSSEKTPAHRYPRPGVYKVRAILYTECFSDTAFTEVRVESYPSIKVPPQIRDTSICQGQVLQLNVQVPTATAFQWENGLIWPNREIREAGNYAVTVFNECSHDRVPFTVKVKECTCLSFVPTAFTPNNDGRNDVFGPVMECFTPKMVFRIFSRYGDKVFETTTMNKGWDGKIRSVPANAGVYAWTLEYQHPGTREIIRNNGTVVLIR